MEHEENIADRPDVIVNGFQFNDANTKLLAYALNLHRLGAKIGPEFWTQHIISDVVEQSDDGFDKLAGVDEPARPITSSDLLMHQLTVVGPVITRRDFCLFDSLEKCRNDAAIVLEALSRGLLHMHGSMIEIWAIIADNPVKVLTEKQMTSLGRATLRYLTSSAKLDEQDERVSVATVHADSEPVLIHVPTTPVDQYVFSGSWTHVSHLGPRADKLRLWYYNHQLTRFRMQQLLNIFLTLDFPEKFKA
ncbi:hypothetical protein MPK74_gp034 [Erwinia phage pEa_SNUABM_7]|uniref:Uncharacterized protein n=1 Tax=Erwinia phage pEa_SNUABM_7 TaxID=2866695 RepID=A0AAE7WS42_9CAUD|nr:hypothetical protein MPK74_gp034 [Erwinia phage pEa_SNUABM_7]QYW04702.1 hypothetical protein pEaSNUABM7_00034 [Erwinia phage pEa_SNUABM_7]